MMLARQNVHYHYIIWRKIVDEVHVCVFIYCIHAHNVQQQNILSLKLLNMISKVS